LHQNYNKKQQQTKVTFFAGKKLWIVLFNKLLKRSIYRFSEGNKKARQRQALNFDITFL